MAQTPEQMAASMVANLKEKTGKTLPEWLQVVRKSKLAKHGEIVKMLKADHGIGHGYANLVAHHALQADGAASSDDLIEVQYAGPKSALRPLYEQLLQEVRKFGKDIEVSPKKAYVSLRRNKQFATIQPSTKTRVDVGLNLKGVAPSGRLQAATGMVSHKVAVTAAKDIDTNLRKWLKQAYEAS